MAAQTQTQTDQPRPTTRATSRRASKGVAGKRRKPAKRRTQAANIGELERVIRDLEDRIAYLTSDQGIRSTVSGATNHVGRAVTRASDHVGDLVADTLLDVAERLRGGATSVTGGARVATGAIQKIGAEMERRPLITVAIALGIGFLAGLAGKRADQA